MTVPTSEPETPAAAPPTASSTGGASKPRKLTIVEQLKLSPNRWKLNGKELEPGVGGIWPGKPDAKTYKVRRGEEGSEGAVEVNCMCLPASSDSCADSGLEERMGRRRRAAFSQEVPLVLTQSCGLVCGGVQVTIRDVKNGVNYTMDVPEDRCVVHNRLSDLVSHTPCCSLPAFRSPRCGRRFDDCLTHHEDDVFCVVVCRYIFWAFEDAGIELPMINKHRMCRNGCCTTCALKVRAWPAALWRLSDSYTMHVCLVAVI